MALLRDYRADFAGIVGNAARARGLDPAFIEKDYWVVELLRSLCAPLSAGSDDPPMTGLIVFKGGTSLSKAYGLIERFSEDVDILVVPPAGLGKGAVDRILKSLVKRASEDLGVPGHLKTSTTGVKRYVTFGYPAVHSASALRSDLLLEMGTRGGPHPSHDVSVTSYVAQQIEEEDTSLSLDDLEPVSVRVLAPERTLVEKLQLVHTAASRFEEDPGLLHRSGRHFYDIHQLVLSDEVMAALSRHAGGISGMADEIHELSSHAGFDSVRRPSGGYAESPAFAREDLRPVISQAYGDIAPLVWGDLPPVDSVMSAVRESAALL